MTLLLIIVVALLLFGGGGLYGYRSGAYGGQGLGIVWLVLLLLVLYLVFGSPYAYRG